METEIRAENLALFEARPDMWKFALAVDRLEMPLDACIQSIENAEPVHSSYLMSEGASSSLLFEQLDVLSRAIYALKELLEKDLQDAWEQDGDAEKIDNVCQSILSISRNFIEAERTILTTPLNPRLAPFQSEIAGLSMRNLGQLRRIVRGVRSVIEANATGVNRLEAYLDADRIEDIRRRIKDCTSPYPECPRLIRGALPFFEGLGDILAVAFWLGAFVVVLAIMTSCLPWWVIALLILFSFCPRQRQ